MLFMVSLRGTTEDIKQYKLYRNKFTYLKEQAKQYITKKLFRRANTMSYSCGKQSMILPNPKKDELVVSKN